MKLIEKYALAEYQIEELKKRLVEISEEKIKAVRLIRDIAPNMLPAELRLRRQNLLKKETV